MLPTAQEMDASLAPHYSSVILWNFHRTQKENTFTEIIASYWHVLFQSTSIEFFYFSYATFVSLFLHIEKPSSNNMLPNYSILQTHIQQYLNCYTSIIFLNLNKVQKFCSVCFTDGQLSKYCLENILVSILYSSHPILVDLFHNYVHLYRVSPILAHLIFSWPYVKE